MSVFQAIDYDDHERVLFCRDKVAGLSAIIAIHSTQLGPSAGGCRSWHYETDETALTDALRLSRGMSYKNAMAGLGMGGGKAVIMLAEGQSVSEPMLEAFGRFVDTLDGAYITAEDAGMSEAAMEIVARQTRYVTGLPSSADNAGGNPSPVTAFGVFHGIVAAAEFASGHRTLEGLSVAVQGVGNVGFHLCKLLSEAGARLVVADIDANRVQRCVSEFGATAVGLDEILYQDVDILAPCAFGGVLNHESIPKIKAGIIAGGANNQLQTDADGQTVMDRGILYAPDYVINGGGIISCTCEYYQGVSSEHVYRKAAEIGPRLNGIFELSKVQDKPTNIIADQMASELIAAGPSETPLVLKD